MPLPPLTTQFTPGTSAPAIRRSVSVANMTNGKYQQRGPFMATFVPVDGMVQLPNYAELVQVDARIRLPLESAARARAIVTDLASNTTYFVLFARTFVDCIEVSVRRDQGDQ